MKEIVVKVPGADTKHKLSIKPETSAQDILNNVDMPDYNLRRPGSDDVNDTFGSEEDVYAQVKDGQVLLAGSDSPVGG